MSTNLCQTPHLAIIHLLRAVGCCSDQPSPSPLPTIPTSVSSHLLFQKQQSQLSLSQLQFQLSNSPCAIQLQQQILNLQHLATGLRHENQFRKQEGWMELQKMSNAYSTQGSDFLQQQSEKVGEEMAMYKSQHRRLEEEYQLLILRVKKLHEWNEGIVNSYGKQRWEGERSRSRERWERI